MTDQTLEQLEREYREKVQGWHVDVARAPDGHFVLRSPGEQYKYWGPPRPSVESAWLNLPPLTDTEYFGPGGLLDKLPKSARRDVFVDLAMQFDQVSDEFIPPSEALKKVILIAYLKGKE